FGIVEPAQDDETAMSAAGVEPVTHPEVPGRNRKAYMPVRVPLDTLVGHRAVPTAWLQALVPDVFQGDVPVPGVGRLDVEHQRLVGLEPESPDHVQVVRSGVGVPEICRLR